MHTLSLLALLGVLGSPQVSPESPGPTLWAGHQVTFGKKDVPLRGEVTTRTDALVLARVRWDGERLELEERACEVRVRPVGRTRVEMDTTRLPRTKMVLRLQDDGTFEGSSSVQWDREDVDEDGNPGMTVTVDAPLCAGELRVSNHSRTQARAWFTHDAFRGEAVVRVRQKVLGAQGACLSMFAPDTDERVRGPFAYVPVPDGTTCETLLEQGWPVDAQD